MQKKIVITLTPLRFYSPYDEEAFFQWLKNVKCIKKIEGIRKELYLYISFSKLSLTNVREFFALFKRYKFKNIKQLEIFKNESNKVWFED